MFETLFDAMGLDEGYDGLRRGLASAVIACAALMMLFQSTMIVHLFEISLLYLLSSLVNGNLASWFENAMDIAWFPVTILIFCLMFRPVFGLVLVAICCVAWGLFATRSLFSAFDVQIFTTDVTVGLLLKWILAVTVTLFVALVALGFQIQFIEDNFDSI